MAKASVDEPATFNLETGDEVPIPTSPSVPTLNNNKDAAPGALLKTLKAASVLKIFHTVLARDF